MHLKHTGDHRPGKTVREMYVRECTPQDLNSWLTCQRPGREGWARILITSPAAVHAAAVTHFHLFLSNWDSHQTLYLQREVTLFSLLKILLDLEKMIHNQPRNNWFWSDKVSFTVSMKNNVCVHYEHVRSWFSSDKVSFTAPMKNSACVHCEHVRSFGFFVFNSEPLITILVDMW